MNWENEYNEALQYEKAAKGMAFTEKVDNETLYHIICLAIEKFTSSLAAKENYIPVNSALNLIFRELGKKVEIPVTFYTEVRFINSFMTYCSLEIQEPKQISGNDIKRMLKFLDSLKTLLMTKELI
jgi:hypothetical protein